jgi:hypothetical protein
MNEVTKILCIVTVGIASVITQSCSDFFDAEHKKVKVSFSFDSEPEVFPSRSNKSMNEVNEVFFKPSLKKENRGELVEKYTPSDFVLCVDHILVYRNDNSDIQTEYLLRRKTNPKGTVIPNHINVVHADNIVKSKELLRDSIDGISIQLSSEQSDNLRDKLYFLSIVGVNLGSEYRDIVFPNEIKDRSKFKDTTLHYFPFDELQPFDVQLAYLTIGSDIHAMGLKSVESDDGFWYIPGMEASGKISQLFLKGNSLNINKMKNPEILFNWDLNNLVHVYDSNTPEEDDDVVCFNLSNPFPIMVQARDIGMMSKSVYTYNSISEVGMLSIGGKNSYNTLQWVNPSEKYFKRVVIVRNQGEEPMSYTDGDIVFEGIGSSFCDLTATPGKKYFYKVYVVDSEGNYSKGLTVSQVQPNLL